MAGADGLAELEHVGPLTELSSGGKTSLRQELRLIENEPLSLGGVDDWVAQARRQIATAARP